MRRLDELGVSPAPWRAESGPFASMVYENAPTDKCASVCASVGERRKADASLIAAAPDLYEALREAVEYRCCSCTYGGQSADDFSLLPCRLTEPCSWQRWRKALEKAGGGE